MSDERPTVSAQLVARVVESAPDRVRRRLDRTPDAAAGWDWQQDDNAWSVQAGGETVKLPREHIHGIDQVSCTCLLSPKCFHVLACLTALEVEVAGGKDNVSSSAELGEQSDSEASGAPADVAQPSEKQRRAADDLAESMAQLLRVGVASAGVVVQSGLLRAVHQCRAEGLYRAAAVGLRVIAGTRQFRTHSAESDPGQLAEDVADVLETTKQILSQASLPTYWVGTARRSQFPVRPRKLHGLLAEPIVTRSGFAGAAVYFLGEDGQIYTASDVRPGDAQLARDAYLGGIEIGPMTQPAKQLARGLYLGTDLTASPDGRLGRGKEIKIAEQGQSSWQVEPVQRRFQNPLSDQWTTVYAKALLPADVRPAGWDFVFLSGAIVGACGAELLFQLTTNEQLLRLAIENENASLYFRENLRMLSYAPGLKLQVIGRLNLQQPTIVYPLAVSEFVGDDQRDNEPRMDLPKSLGGRVFLGFDEIQRSHLLNAHTSAMVLIEQDVQPIDDPLASLHRRWIAKMLSGNASGRQSSTITVAAETAALSRHGFATGAALLDALSRSNSDAAPSSIDTFLAAALYLRSCRYELAKARATLSIATAE